MLHGDHVLAEGTGPEERDDKQCTLLNRVLLWTETGIVYEADPRHVELILAEAGTLHAKELSTLSVRATPEEWAAAQPLKPAEQRQQGPCFLAWTGETSLTQRRRYAEGCLHRTPCTCAC
eukprot:1192760-Amphidinium_carterae.1